ncbi:hypothetical protein C0992_006608 [Termitomyces sp. T32_za158]|nr:hypothetical protein C0992_006608 [Termitomyces sp. T32_za158]
MAANSTGINPHSLLHKRRIVQPAKSNNTRDIRKEQTRLSENMELLGRFHYRDPSKKLSNAKSAVEDREVLHILDIISVCFATGQDGDVIATMVTIEEKAQKVCFFLANNRSGAPSAREEYAIHNFRKMIAGAKTYKDLIPFVAGYSSQNVTNRVQKLRTGFDNVLSSRNIIQAIKAIDTKSVFLSLLQGCSQLTRSMSQSKSNGDYQLLGTTASCSEFARLIETVKKLEDRPEWELLHNQIEHSSTVERHFNSKGLTECTRTLYRRLCKISQYRALESLIRFIAAHKDYEFEWASDLFQSERTGEMSIKSHSLERIARSRVDQLVDQQKPQRRTEYDAFVVKAKEKAKEHPEKWPNEFVTNIHCEIRIIRYCTAMFGNGAFAPRELIIGTSKRCCLFCDEWISLFNKIAGYNFKTGGSHGKAYRRAALTGVDDKSWVATDKNLVEVIDKHVISCIRSNIRTHRVKLEAPSDEYASSMEEWPDFANESYKINYTAKIDIQENEVNGM